MDPGVIAIIVLSGFLVIWYIAASSYNRRRGMAVYRWLRSGLEHFGEITQSGWFGSAGTGANLVVAKPEKPLRNIEAHFYLETREIFPYWLVTHLGGKRDELSMQATLRFSPQVEILVKNTRNMKQVEVASNDAMDSYEQEAAPEGYTILRHGTHDIKSIELLLEILTATDGSIQSVYLKRGQPHLVIRSKLSPLLDKSPESIFTTLQMWLQSIAK